MGLNDKDILIIIVFVAVVVGAILGFNWYEERQASFAKIPPNAPSDLISEPSAIATKLIWRDNSNNEDGFRLYRDGAIIKIIPKDTEEYIDVGLRPATSYRYEIKAYNQAGESDIATCFTKTLNPPIIVLVDKIGVHNNGEEGEPFRQIFNEYGEIYVGSVITDGLTTTKQLLPSKGTYKLKREEITDVGIVVFSTPQVGDNLTLVFIGYEDDGGFTEQVMYKAFDIITKSYIDTPISLLLTLAGVDFAKIFGEIFGAEDDFMGTYIAAWTVNDNWGVGEYADIQCKDKNGEIGLRLWLRIKCPIYDYSLENPHP